MIGPANREMSLAFADWHGLTYPGSGERGSCELADVGVLAVLRCVLTGWDAT
jgi:hypothetical protein